MSFINGLSDFTVSISSQPSSTATQRFCCDQIWLPWIGTATRIPCCQTKQLPQLARVFKRLADRLQGVVSDTSTITITPEYAAHFLEVYVTGKKIDGAKFTGDRIRFLMLALPLAVRDLIAPEVYT